MKLIIGLGNPGKQYENTRHNAGFIALDEIQRLWNFPPFTFSKKFDAEISEAVYAGEKIILAKPQTFMNLSGKSVRALMDFYKFTPANLVVLQDELDIELGRYKISTDSSAAGHNGIASIIQQLGTQQFKRIRIGIEGTELKKQRLACGSDFVLQKFTPEELEVIQELTKKIVQEL